MAEKQATRSLYRVQVLDRALAILDVLSQKREGAGLAEIAAMVRLHKSTVHRLIMSLEKHRLVDRNPQTGCYRLGIRLFDLGMISISCFDIRTRARPHLEQLMYNTGETVHLCLLDDGQMLYLDKVEPDRSVRMSSKIGRRNPVHCTAVGKAVLAALPEAEVDAILRQHGMRRFTPRTLVTPAELKAELKKIAEQGYAFDDEENEEGVRCIGAMVREYSGRPVAAISISVPSFRLPLEKVPVLGALVSQTAQTITLECGFRAPDAHSAAGSQ
jgi:DNA-binding IclR family transcriptional regulator